jgi:hypothetical protein
MATQSASTAPQPADAVIRPASVNSAKPARSGTKRWLFAAFLLAGAAQLITISALLSADPIAASWSALLLAVAPVLLTAMAAFAPRGLALPAAAAATVALLVGLIGGISHTGPLFIPALVAVVMGGVRIWRADTA